VNYYQLKDSLTGHVDQSEPDAEKPLISISLGHSSIFLIGGPTRDEAPLSLLLRSGDVVIMCGKKGRRRFHGLPRVIPDSLPDHLTSESGDVEWRDIGVWLGGGARVNVNVRQVF